MGSLQNSTSHPVQNRPTVEAILLGAIAVFVVQMFRAGYHPSVWWIRLETCVYLAIPLFSFGWVTRQIESCVTHAGEMKWKYRIQIGALAFALLPVFSQFLSRQFGIGDANEVIVLVMIQNAAWYATVFAAFWNFRRVGFLLSSVLVLFVGLSSEDWKILGLALLYSLVAIWWLMGNYWSRLEAKVIDGKAKSLPVRWSFLTLSGIIVATVGCLAWSFEPVMQTIGVAGFMPTSGGQNWSDQYARSGVGDGEMLVAGDDATTTGAVDSDQFIEDSRPSMYDAFNEIFDDPEIKKNNRRDRAIALSQVAKHIHDVKQSEQSGRSFRVVRKPGRKLKTERELESVISKALFYLEGTVPVRLKTNTFNHFDGWDWSNREIAWDEQPNSGLQVKSIDSEPWFIVQSPKRHFLSSSRNHRIKIMRLESSAIPSPSFLERWHIFKVGKRKMFSWGEGGVVEYSGKLPRQTMIDIVSSVPNYHVLRATNRYTNSVTEDSNGILNWVDGLLGIVHNMPVSKKQEFKTLQDSDLQLVQTSDETTKMRLRAIADEWTRGIDPGWNQVEAIIDRFRTDYSVDPANVPEADCENAIEHFLDEESSPGYLFATTAAQMLRAAGYKTRLATGFLVEKKDYFLQARQSIATSENVHVWPEVCLDGCHWIPLEPTPGFSIPYSTETVGQFLARKFNEASAWILSNPISSFVSMFFLVFAAWFRAKLFAGFWWLIWLVVFKISSKSRLRITRQLIDARFRVAGYARPPSALVAQWFRQVDQSAGKCFFQLWQAANFSSLSSDIPDHEVADACWQLVADLPYQKIELFAKQAKVRKEFND